MTKPFFGVFPLWQNDPNEFDNDFKESMTAFWTCFDFILLADDISFAKCLSASQRSMSPGII